MDEYCLGFMLSPDRDLVVLMRKNRPAWQAGKLNGIGGKVEQTDETPKCAMVREFVEETGILTRLEDWIPCGTIDSVSGNGKRFKVHCYSAISPLYNQIVTKTDEPVVLIPTDLKYIQENAVPNVATLLAHAMSGNPAKLRLRYE